MPKSLFTLLLAVLLSGVGNAQSENYRLFEWDLIRIGYAFPGGDRFGPGLALGTEVRYNASDRISVGFRPELAVYTSDLDGATVDVGAAASFTAFGDYYLRTEGGFRPFGGVGIGRFGGASATVEDTDDEIEEDDIAVAETVGLVPRIGLELGHFRISLEYNITLGREVPSYFSIMIAPTLFGGPKNREQR